MKKMTLRLFALLLAALLTLSMTGCDIDDILTGGAKTKLIGQWESVIEVETALTKEILEDLDFYAEEIALLDLGGMHCVKLVSFTEDGNYLFSYDVEQSRTLVREYFRSCIDTLYENRSQLVSLYEEAIVEMTLEEFREYYASLFELESFAMLLDLYENNSLDFDLLSQPLEKGTYTIGTKLIMCTIEGEYEAQGMEYEISDNTLKLVYTNGTENYTRR